MKVRFNEQQIALLEKAQSQGFLTMQDLIAVYSSPLTRKNNIERFIALGYLKLGENINKFEYIKKDE